MRDFPNQVQEFIEETYLQQINPKLIRAKFSWIGLKLEKIMKEMRRNQQFFIIELRKRIPFRGQPLKWYYDLKNEDMQLFVNVLVLLIFFLTIALVIK